MSLNCRSTVFLVILLTSLHYYHGKCSSLSSNASSNKESPFKKITSKICERCHCQPLDDEPYNKVDCVHRQLEEIPNAQDLPLHTFFLDLNQNNIKTLKKFEANDDLVHLSLSTNGLKHSGLDSFAFELLPKIAYLDLSFNEIESLPVTIFENLKVLQYLNLSTNKLEYLPNGLFKNNGDLFELNLSHNPLKFIDPDVFDYLYQLEVLNLAGCEFISLSSGLFHQLRKLQSLNIAENLFQNVPINALHPIKNLQVLDISKNPIRILNQESFFQLVELRKLRIHSMPSLVRIEKKTFSSLYLLENLEIDENVHLSHIDKNAFSGIFNYSYISLKHVSFRRNQLKTLYETMLPFCNLTYLDLRYNPWDCNCHVHWIKYCYGKDKTHETSIVCATPSKHQGHELVFIPHKELVCQDGIVHSASFLFIISMFFMILLFFTMLVLVFKDRISKFYGGDRKQGSIYYVRAKSNNEFVNEI